MTVGDEPIAWGYVRPPLYYSHAIQEWKRRLNALAASEGYTISWWCSDVSSESFALETMLSLLPGSSIAALFVPDRNHFSLPSVTTDYDGSPLYQHVPRCTGLTQAELSIHLNRPVFMLQTDGGVASIKPIGDPRIRVGDWSRPTTTTPRRRRLFRLRAPS